ncbi:Nuclear pore complex protein Nup93 [Armadillidium nasatum]|uniref:Nuclear pore protein n=1 Tax=Armadillidium nasatum TaxID=96803 RepID=A0A5N5TAH5_9CRUS|nr:Nuclear pore complex protein Nup93 [Armadillidium nasatum]
MTHTEVERLFWEQQKAEWEQAKQKFMSCFANINAEALNFTPQPQESLVHSMSFSKGSGVLSIEEAAYAKTNIIDLWALVCSIVEVPISVVGNAKSRTLSKVQAILVRQAKAHLEKSYERHMRQLVFSHLEKATLGGVPGLVPLVKAYLSVLLPPQSQAHLEDGEAKGVPVWPLIFYCLRAGGPKAAALAAQENSNPSVAEIVPALEALEKSESGRLSIDLEKKLKLSYKRNAKSITDPFKRTVYCLLCRCDVDDDHSDIIATTDDYLWLKLSLVECENISPHLTPSNQKRTMDDVLTLSQFQNLLYKKYGEKHFNAWQQPLLYMSVLLLSCQFEAGIEFLSRIERLRCHAVHVALALHESNLLVLPSQTSAPLLSNEEGDVEGFYRLNLVQLVKLYVKKFEITNLNEVLHYYYFLRNLKGCSQNMFTECVSELVLQTREFDTLLGMLNTDGSRTPGLVDKFKVDVCEIAEVVAKDSEKKGLHEDAIKLYDLAKNHEKALTLLNQLMSQVVHQRGQSEMSSHGSKRERVMEMATAIALRFKTHGHNATAPSIATLHVLLDMATFFDLYHQERFSEAVKILKRLKIVALAKDEVESRVTSMPSFGLEVKTVLPHVLLAAMTSTYRLYQAPSQNLFSPLSSTPVSSPAISVLNMSSQMLPATKHLKEQARAIVTFAGMIPLRLNADVNARLVQLEALIN